MEQRFEGAVALVTGGVSGLGEAAARRLVGQLGMDAVLMDLNEERGAELAASLARLFPRRRVQFARADVSREEDVLAALALVGDRPLRAVVNCAGIGGAVRLVSRGGKPMPLDAFRHVLNVNLVGTFNVSRLAAAHMMAHTPPLEPDGERGVIVNVASVAAFDGQVGQVAYSASKSGCVGMTLPIARDLAPMGIRCSCIAPGIFLTPMMKMGGDALMEGLRRDVQFPRRLGDPDEFAATVAHILTNRYMNGNVIRLDGAIRMPAKSRPAKL